MARHSSKTTTDHQEIQHWAEERGAQPARVKGTGSNGDPGMIRLDFPGYSGADSLEHISWDDWFKSFDENNLALVHQDKTAKGEQSNFNKLVGRETAEKRSHGESHASRHSSRKQSSTRAGSRASGSRSSKSRSSGSRSTASRSTGSASGSSRSSSRSASSRSASRRSSGGRKTANAKSAKKGR
jgi:hypothetical protein